MTCTAATVVGPETKKINTLYYEGELRENQDGKSKK